MADLSLSHYHLLGGTGLRVSPLALGAAMFGQPGVGSDEETSRAIFRHYLDAGGNFVDTADVYAGGRSEELLGTFLRETASRDWFVIATKFTMATEPGNPNAGGNGRKNIMASLDASLRRLGTDYVDLYWMHAWDGMTPVEEVMSTLDALVRSGKVRAVGLSNPPAWYAGTAQTLARWRGWEPVAALELEYSLISRQIEREHIPAALNLGMGVVGWSPLANGFLTGKYTRSPDGPTGSGRLEAAKGAPGIPGNSDRDWRVLDALRTVAKEVGASPAQVGISWVTRRPGVAATLVGARTVEQLADNLASLDVSLAPEQRERLEEASATEPVSPYLLFSGDMRRQAIDGGTQVRAEPTWFRPA